MTTLSPAAKFVLAACDDAVNKLPLSAPPESFSICLIATALRETVNQLKFIGITEKNILAIAAELESQ